MQLHLMCNATLSDCNPDSQNVSSSPQEQNL